MYSCTFSVSPFLCYLKKNTRLTWFLVISANVYIKFREDISKQYNQYFFQSWMWIWLLGKHGKMLVSNMIYLYINRIYSIWKLIKIQITHVKGGYLRPLDFCLQYMPRSSLYNQSNRSLYYSSLAPVVTRLSAQKATVCLKQQNRYLSVIIVCGYFSFIRSFTCLNVPSKSNSYHNTSLSMSFGCWHLSGIPLCPLHFTVYTIAWQRKFEPQWVFNINLCILSG